MNADTRRQIIERAHERELALIDTKGREYTGGAEQGNDLDTLANFKRVAERTGLNALQVWGVYFLKHVDAIGTYLQDPTRETSEPITGRIDDARTYLGLLECLLVDLDPVEQRNAKPPYQLLVKAERGACPCGAGAKGDGHICNLRAQIDARTPRRCDYCDTPVDEFGFQFRHDGRLAEYCTAACSRRGEERRRLEASTS